MEGLDDLFGSSYSEVEAVRRDTFSRLLHTSIGLLPLDLEAFTYARILDIGCDSGTWINEMTYHPSRPLMVGSDPRKEMIDNAILKTSGRPSCNFQLWNPFSSEEDSPFRAGFFDLITLHFASRWVGSALSWLPLLNTCWLYLKRDGRLLIQDYDGLSTTSPALTRLNTLIDQAHHKTGRSLRGVQASGPIVALMGGLRHAHFAFPTVTCSSVDFSFTHPEHNYAWRDQIRILIHQITPYLITTGVATAGDLADLTVACDAELFQEDFYGVASVFNLTAQKPKA